VQQLLPLLRFDGYHLLADLTGVPDLYHRIRPTLLGLLPHRWSHPESRVLKPWARAVITVWVLITVPMLALMLFAMVSAVPRLLGTGWSVVQEDAAGVQDAWRDGGLVDVTAHAFQVLAVVLPLLGCFLILGRMGLRSSRGLARWSRNSASKRVVAAALSAVAVTSLSWAWWPQPGTYEPIGSEERGLLTALLPTAQEAPAAASRPAPMLPELPVGASAEQRLADGGPLEATFQQGKALPTKSDPQLAMVLVPSGSGSQGQPTAPDDPPATDDPDEPWVFPFDEPLPPAEGDNQAAAYNTTDDSMKYDVAFALVWATGDEVLNVNEAHAYASCSNCVTVAVAFQVVLIMDNAHVVVPQNLSVAANYQCYRCITAAIASQLVLSVEDTPGEEQLLALGAVWDRLTEFGQSITAYSLSQISTQLEAFQAEIVAILGHAPPVPDTSAPAPPAGTSTPGSGEPSPTSPPPGSSDSSSTTSQPSSQEPNETPQPTSEPSTQPAPEQATEPSTSPSSPEPSPDTTTSSPSP
jgi:putative peptide zinc metalloprotease protein